MQCLWAIEVVKNEGWLNVIWSSDSKIMVNEITADLEPSRWETRLGILQIKEINSSFNWLFVWNARTANQCADSAAKYSLSNVCCLYFDFSSLFSIPPSLLLLINVDKEGGV